MTRTQTQNIAGLWQKGVTMYYRMADEIYAIWLVDDSAKDLLLYSESLLHYKFDMDMDLFFSFLIYKWKTRK